MDINEIHVLTRYRDPSDEAKALRLRAARMFVTRSQTEFAKLVGIKKTTYNWQEVGGHPSPEVLDYLYLNHEIGPNFILYGDVRRLPVEAIEAIVAALREPD